MARGERPARPGSYNITEAGAGGAGVRLGAGANLIATGVITGGQGGAGGQRYQIGEGGGGVGVYLMKGATLTNDGVISGGRDGAGGSGFARGVGGGGSGVAVYHGGRVFNAGSITVGADGAAGGKQGGAGLILWYGDGHSSGQIDGGQGGGDGVVLERGGDFQNSGQIIGGLGDANSDGRGGSGVADVSGLLVNTGTISGGLGEGGQARLQGFGVYAGGGAIVNGSASARSALLVGYEGVYTATSDTQAVTVTNFGTIDGTDGVAVQFDGFGSKNNRLVVEAGGVFLGAVFGGGGTLELAAGAGALTGLGGALTNFMSIDVDAGGQWALSGTGAERAAWSIAATGTVVAIAGAPLTMNGALTNDGELDADDGHLLVLGAVTGAGDVAIAGGEAAFASGFSQAVSFGSAGGDLELGDSQAFGAIVSGFSAAGATAFDLRDIGFVSAGEATFSGTAKGGVLTVTDGGHTARIDLSGDYVNVVFVASSDGKGGVDVVASSPGSPHAFIAAMAGLGGSAGEALHTGQTPLERAATLMAPRAQIA